MKRFLMRNCIILLTLIFLVVPYGITIIPFLTLFQVFLCRKNLKLIYINLPLILTLTIGCSSLSIGLLWSSLYGTKYEYLRSHFTESFLYMAQFISIGCFIIFLPLQVLLWVVFWLKKEKIICFLYKKKIIYNN